MSRTRAVAGGGRAVEVEPERVAGWFERFAERHGTAVRTVVTGGLAPGGWVRVEATDGASATCTVPFGPLGVADGQTPGLAIGPLVEHLLRPRRVGLLLVRLGGHSVGVARDGVVESSRTDRRLVQGRSAAGGWSQQRFARRRQGQARQALRAATEDAVRVLAPLVSEVDAVVLGGDQRALETLRADRRLAELFAKAESRVLDVAEPRRSVLEDAAERARCVEIVVRDR